MSVSALVALAQFIVKEQHPELLYGAGLEDELLRRSKKLYDAVLVKQGLLERDQRSPLAFEKEFDVFQEMDHEERIIALEYLRKPFEQAWKRCRDPVAMMDVAWMLYPGDEANLTDNKELIGCVGRILIDSGLINTRAVSRAARALVSYSVDELDLDSTQKAVDFAIDRIPPSNQAAIYLRDALSAAMRNTPGATNFILQSLRTGNSNWVLREMADLIRKCLGTPSVWLALQ